MVVVSVVVPPTVPLNKLRAPGAVPASKKYATAPGAAFHITVTTLPDRVKLSPVGVEGNAHPVTASMISFDAAPTPAAATPRTRM